MTHDNEPVLVSMYSKVIFYLFIVQSSGDSLPNSEFKRVS